MIVPMHRLGRLFGDRVLLRKLDRPERRKGLYLPVSTLKNRPQEQEIWYGVIEAFGLDSRYGDAYGLKEGDIVGVNDLGISNASFIGDDEHEHFWVMEEFLVLKDEGRVRLHRLDQEYEGPGCGLLPLGAYSVIAPAPIEEKRNGVHIPHTAQNASLLGKVIAVSAGEVKAGELHTLHVKPDVDVLYGQYSGLKAQFGQTEYLLIKEEDLIAELDPEKETITTGKEAVHA